MASTHGYGWAFRTKFRARAFGWKGTRLATQRLREALSEIRRVAKKDPVLAGEGAVLLIERLWSALEQIDSSSGALGTAVSHAVDALVDVLVAAPADGATRARWLERLWQAYQEDGVEFTIGVAERWGELCGAREVAAQWADQLIGTVRLSWSPDPDVRGYFNGTPACLSALLAAGRYPEILDLLEHAPYVAWDYRQWGVRALVALGKKAEALRYAEASQGLNDGPFAIARACEEMLLSSGLVEEAYERYALVANQGTSHLATYRALAKKYPHKAPAVLLADLVRSTPGDEGKWFAATKGAGLLDLAIALARKSPCDPRTLTRAARDHATDHPAFAIEAGILALHWLVQGFGYEITGADVWAAYAAATRAAESAGLADATRERIRALVGAETLSDRFVTRLLGRELGLG